jgi:hypothetical protein
MAASRRAAPAALPGSATSGDSVLYYRVTDTGTQDPSFGSAGRLEFSRAGGLPPQGDKLQPLQAGPGGTFYQARDYPDGPTNSTVELRRFTADGAPDPTFGTGGVAHVPRAVLSDVLKFSADPTSGYMLLVGPNPQVPEGERQAGGFQAVRLHADGTPDSAFGGPEAPWSSPRCRPSTGTPSSAPSSCRTAPRWPPSTATTR